MWTQTEAIAFARSLEGIAPHVGAHIALTGGCLYKDGPRKDLDIVVYRIRQRAKIEREAFFQALKAIGLTVEKDTGFVVKAKIRGLPVDFLFPEYPGGTYDPVTNTT